MLNAVAVNLSFAFFSAYFHVSFHAVSISLKPEKIILHFLSRRMQGSSEKRQRDKFLFKISIFYCTTWDMEWLIK